MALKIVRKTGHGAIVSTAGVVVSGSGIIIDAPATTGGTYNLPAVSGNTNLYVNNSGVPLAIIPASATEGTTLVIIDAGGTAGSFPISWQGTIVGAGVNPVLIYVNYASATIQFHTGNWYRIA